MISVLILFGGLSSEHEVSCKSAASILSNIDRNKYNVSVLGITKNGRWKLYDNPDPEKIRTGLWEREPGLRSAVLAPDRAVHGLIIDTGRGTTVRYIDVCFPVLHGFGGEDGTMQGLLTLAGIPYVGPALRRPQTVWIRA
jgi:D-alanine-D-alanine ligase